MFEKYEQEPPIVKLGNSTHQNKKKYKENNIKSALKHRNIEGIE